MKEALCLAPFAFAAIPLAPEIAAFSLASIIAGALYKDSKAAISWLCDNIDKIEDFMVLCVTLETEAQIVESVAVADLFESIFFAKKKSKTYETEEATDEQEYKKPVSGKSAKEAAKDAPSWAKGNAPQTNENGNEFAKRLCDKKFGPGNYDKGPASEYNKIRKWGDRGFE